MGSWLLVIEEFKGMSLSLFVHDWKTSIAKVEVILMGLREVKRLGLWEDACLLSWKSLGVSYYRPRVLFDR